jgi:type II secretory pathway pseudopilin PulG
MHDTPLHTAGFSLLEVVVALSLLITLSVGVATVFVSSGRAVAAARAAALGSVLVRDKLEQLRTLPLDDPALVPVGLDTLRGDVDGYHDAPLPRLRRRWSIAVLPAHPTLAIVLQVNVLTDDGRLVAGAVMIRTRKAT